MRLYRTIFFGWNTIESHFLIGEIKRKKENSKKIYFVCEGFFLFCVLIVRSEVVDVSQNSNLQTEQKHKKRVLYTNNCKKLNKLTKQLNF